MGCEKDRTMVDASQCLAHSRRLTHSRRLAHFISFSAAPCRFSELDKGQEGCSSLWPLQAGEKRSATHLSRGTG